MVLSPGGTDFPEPTLHITISNLLNFLEIESVIFFASFGFETSPGIKSKFLFFLLILKVFNFSRIYYDFCTFFNKF